MWRVDRVPLSFNVTDDELDAPDGAVVDGWERVGGRWVQRGEPRLVAWCMLNPSTADESKLDPTLRRVDGFTRAWGYDGFVVVNLFALRATDPRELLGRDPYGDGNFEAIASVVRDAALVVCGWGAHPAAGLGGYGSTGPVRDTIRWSIEKPHHLGLTKNGHPRHPLYLRGSVRPEPWMTLADAVRRTVALGQNSSR